MTGASTVERRRDPLILVCGSDDNYSMALAVAIHSALSHLERGCLLNLYIIDGGICEINKQRLHRVVQVDHVDVHLKWVAPDMTLVSDLKVSGHVTAATYFSLLVPDVVPERFDKAIYLDCDILVETDLQQLWQEELGSYALLAVRDFLIPYVSSPGGLAKYKDLGLELQMPYFNAGVMVFNLERWRAESTSQEVFRYLREYRESLTLVDQEGLNAVLAGDWGALNPKWNVASSILSYQRWPESPFKDEIAAMVDGLVNNPHIVHFTGPNKPWHLKCEHPAKVQWRRYLEDSRWFNPLTDVRAAGNFKRRTRSAGKVTPMLRTKVTVAIPTHNRSQLLKDCLERVLIQDYADFHVVVLDDASTDDTESVVRTLADPRVAYTRNETNIGLLGNWNRALEVNRSPYLCILPDDDRMLPHFICRSVMALDEHPQAAFSTGLARMIGADGHLLDVQNAGDIREGLVDGLEYLHRVVADPAWITHSATVMLRSSALATVGAFKAPHAKQLLDLDLYIRLAARFDMVFLREELAEVRLHPGQTREREFRAVEGARPLAMLAERMEAIAHLLQSERAEDPAYRNWLAECLSSLNSHRGRLMRLLVPTLNLTWPEWQQVDAQTIATVIPPGESFLLIDENIWGREFVAGRHALPFPECNGLYWGNPLDDEMAIREIERMRQSGASFMVFVWPAFWWFEHYRLFTQYLRSRFRSVLENDRLVVFDLGTTS